MLMTRYSEIAEHLTATTDHVILAVVPEGFILGTLPSACMCKTQASASSTRLLSFIFFFIQVVDPVWRFLEALV